MFQIEDKVEISVSGKITGVRMSAHQKRILYTVRLEDELGLYIDEVEVTEEMLVKK